MRALILLAIKAEARVLYLHQIIDRVVGRAIIDYYDFNLVIGLPQRAFYRASYVLSVVVAGDHY